MGGFQLGVFSGREISIIGVERAPVAIINFAFFVRDFLVESYINSENFTETRREIYYYKWCARATRVLEIPPPPKPPVETPEFLPRDIQISRMARWANNLPIRCT